MKYLNIVFVKHIKSGKRYVFKALLMRQSNGMIFCSWKLNAG